MVVVLIRGAPASWFSSWSRRISLNTWSYSPSYRLLKGECVNFQYLSAYYVRAKSLHISGAYLMKATTCSNFKPSTNLSLIIPGITIFYGNKPSHCPWMPISSVSSKLLNKILDVTNAAVCTSSMVKIRRFQQQGQEFQSHLSIIDKSNIQTITASCPRSNLETMNFDTNHRTSKNQ